jgi:VIT1/CCC1 family predicted Fe2+/Mn2+ transporter
MLELIVEIFGELLLQIIGEILFELGIHSFSQRREQPTNPWLSVLIYTLLGAALGGLSLLVFPTHLVPQPWRILNLIATPISAGIIMMLMGAWRTRRGQSILQIDRFFCGYLFALSLALVRFKFA